jgi:hypothetical protein
VRAQALGKPNKPKASFSGLGVSDIAGFSISGDDLTFTTAVASIGGSNEVKWKRVK